jgi:hypothetical protein
LKLFFGKKEENIIETFKEHLDIVEIGIKKLQDVFKAYIEENWEELEKVDKEISDIERNADIKRKQIENKMYSKAFLPNFRGDLLGLIENVDKIMNKIQTVSEIIYYQKPFLNTEIKEKMLIQTKLVEKAFYSLRIAIESLFENTEKALNYVKEVEQYEHEEDIVEKNLLKEIFDSKNLQLAEKLQAKDLILQIGDIADRSEDASDRVEIILLKRNI